MGFERDGLFEMGRRKIRRSTAPEFEAVLLLVNRMSAQRREAARLALVDGQTQQSVAERYGWTRNAVDNAERVVWRVYGCYLKAKKAGRSRLPRGWARATIAWPRSAVKKAQLEVATAVSASVGRP